MSEDTILLVDAGNTQTKYMQLSLPIDLAQLPFAGQIKTLHEQHEWAPLITQCSAIYLSAVSKPAWLTSLTALCAQQDIPLHIMQSQKVANVDGCRLQTDYLNPQQMGIDRWLAMQAGAWLAQQQGKHDFVVIDAGTAITADMVVKHRHIGGWIAPGFLSQHYALQNRTAQVMAAVENIAESNVGQTTSACVNLGCAAMLRGFAQQACEYLANYSDDIAIIYSGGDALFLAQQLSADAIFHENLVLLGLAIAAKNGL